MNGNNHTTNVIITKGIIQVSNGTNTTNIASSFGQKDDCVVFSTSFSVINDNMEFSCDQTHCNRVVLRIHMQITSVKCTHKNTEKNRSGSTRKNRVFAKIGIKRDVSHA